VSILGWLEGSALAEAMRSGTWLYAAVESAHLLGLGLLFGSIVGLDLRLIGLSRALAASKAARHLLAPAGIGFGLAAVSGLLMFAADATSLATNAAFQLKLALLLLAGLNAAAFHLGPFRTISRWEQGRRPPRAALLMGATSLVLWTSIVVCGRLIANV
jgi:hypothetical protein